MDERFPSPVEVVAAHAVYGQHLVVPLLEVAGQIARPEADAGRGGRQLHALGGLLQLLHGFFLVGDVLQHAVGSQGTSFFVAGHDSPLAHVADVPVRTPDAVFHTEDGVGFQHAPRFAHDYVMVVGMDEFLPVPVEVREGDAVDTGHFVVPAVEHAVHVEFPESEARGRGGELHVAVGLGEQLLGHFPVRDVGEHAFPHDGTIGHVARGRLGGDPACLAVDDNAAFLFERQLVLEDVGVLAHPFGVVLWMHTGESVHRVFPRRFSLQAGQLEESRRHEREVSHAAVRRLHHGVGADGNVLREFECGALDFLPQGTQGGLRLLALGDVGHGREQAVVEHHGAENDIPLGAVLAGHLEFHGFHATHGFDGAENRLVPFAENLAPVIRIRICLFRPRNHCGHVFQRVTESAGELLVDERHFGRRGQRGGGHGNGQVVEDELQLRLGAFALGDVGHHALPDHAAAGARARHGLKGDVALFAVRRDLSLPEKRLS